MGFRKRRLGVLRAIRESGGIGRKAEPYPDAVLSAPSNVDDLEPVSPHALREAAQAVRTRGPTIHRPRTNLKSQPVEPRGLKGAFPARSRTEPARLYVRTENFGISLPPGFVRSAQHCR